MTRSPTGGRSSTRRARAGANVIVVGLPLSLSGRAGPAAQAALAEVEALRAVAGDIEIVVHDERLTTVTAERALDGGAHAPGRAPAGRRQGRGRGDAAVVAGAGGAMSRRRRTAVVLFGLVVVPLVVLAIGVAWFWWQLDPPGGAGAKVELQIPRGCGVPCIGDALVAPRCHRSVVGLQRVLAAER